MTVYENNNYKIVAIPERRTYEVINLKSGIVEFEDQVYPKCLATADTWSEAVDRHEQKSKERADVVDIRAPR